MNLERSWVPGLISIAKKERKYRYFKLTIPPTDGKQRKDYERTQKSIQNEIQEIKDIIENDIKTDIKMRVDIIKKDLQNRKEEVLKQEKKLFNKLSNRHNRSKDSYSKMSYQERVRLWTKIFLSPKSSKVNEWDNRTCFALLIRSREFYEEVKAKEQEIFTRRLLLKNKKIKNMGNKIDKILYLMIKNELINITKEQLSDDTQKKLIEILEAGAFAKIEQKLQIGKKSKKNKTSKIDKTYEATTFSEHLRNDIRENLVELGIDKMELTNSDNQVFLRVLPTDLRGNEFSKNQDRQVLSEELKNSILIDDTISTIVESIKKTFETIILRMKTNTTFLDLKQLGKIDLSADSKRKDFFEKALKYTKNSLSNFLKGQGKEVIRKTFLATNSNAYVSGLLGELSGAIQISSGNKRTKMTGDVFGEIEGSTFGSSVNDLTLSIGNREFGVNIKHYITDNNNYITLYDSQKKGLSLNSKYLNKYYTQEEIDIMRWAAENQNFIGAGGNFAKDVAYYYSWKEIPTFLRVEDYMDNTVTNLFYQLNNVVYPTSYIYQCVIQQLDKLVNKQDKNKFFAFNYKKKNGIPNTYANLIEALVKNSSKSEYLERHYISGDLKNSNLTIKTNGLKINLMQLNLLK